MLAVRLLIRVLTSLLSFGLFVGLMNAFLLSAVEPSLPAGIKSLGTFPIGFLVVFASLFSFYGGAKLAGYVWKRLG